MSFKINCPEGHVLTVAQQRAGTYVRCPVCMQSVKIPELETLLKLGHEAAKTRETAPSETKPTERADRLERDQSGAASKKTHAAESTQPVPAEASQPAAMSTAAANEKLQDQMDQAATQIEPEAPQPPLPDPKPQLASQMLSEPKDVAEEPSPGEATQQSPTRGVEHDAAKRWIAYYLGISLTLIGLINLGPGIAQVVHYLENQLPMARWAYAALFVGGLQVFYAVYLIQLPDWSSVWVVAVFTLLIATGYAIVLGMVWFGQDDNQVFELLGLGDDLRRNATLWCFSMLSATSLLTYFCGKEAVRWYRIHTRLAKTRG